MTFPKAHLIVLAVCLMPTRAAYSGEAFVSQPEDGQTTSMIKSLLTSAALATPISPAGATNSEAGWTTSMNVTQLTQIGSGNKAAVLQAAGGNVATLIQQGQGNVASIVQTGRSR